MPVYRSITSPSNPLLKDVRRALLRGSLTDEGFCAAESPHLLREAILSRRRVGAVIASESARDLVDAILVGHAGQEIALLPDKLFQSVSSTENSQGVVALVQLSSWPIERMFTERSLVAVLDAIQDPGNAGTIVRAAEAFGASGVIFLKGSASPFHAKTLRASAGSLFRIPFVSAADPTITRAALGHHRLPVYAAMPSFNGVKRLAVSDADFRSPCAFVVGNEARGVSEEFRSEAVPVTIPTAGVESLNASIAAAIFFYEAHRQRSGQ